MYEPMLNAQTSPGENTTRAARIPPPRTGGRPKAGSLFTVQCEPFQTNCRPLSVKTHKLVAELAPMPAIDLGALSAGGRSTEPQRRPFQRNINVWLNWLAEEQGPQVQVVQALPGPVTRSEPLSTAPFGWPIVLTIRQPGEPEAGALSAPPATTRVTAGGS